MKFCSSFINAKTLKEILDHALLSPAEKKALGFSGGLCLGGGFKMPFLCGGGGWTSHLHSRKRSMGKVRGLKVGRMELERRHVSEKIS